MADRFDVVAVRVEHEGGVVIRVVPRAQARRAVVAATGGEGGGVEGVHLRAAGAATLSWGSRRETVVATELSPEQAAPVIKSMLAHAPKMIQKYFDVTPESSLEDVIRDAPNHAVFAVHAV